MKKLFVALALLGIAVGCRVTDLPIWDAPIATGAGDFREILGISYYDGPGSDRVRNSLDIYLPKDRKDFPVVVLVHGGAWILGDNRCCGLYSSVGKYLASRGVGVVMPNYRLSPEVQHPEHAKDVARAVAWTKKNIGSHGGDAKNLYLMGHSAGGHLVALLGTDAQYLMAERISLDEIRGVIAVSGVYRITPGPLEVTLGGDGPGSLRLDEMSPLRGDNLPRWNRLTKGLPVAIDIFAPAFGSDDKMRKAASPIQHVASRRPPFLIFSAENDLPVLGGMAEEFHASLVKANNVSQLVLVKNRNHNSIIFRAIERGDPVADGTLAFIAEKTRSLP